MRIFTTALILLICSVPITGCGDDSGGDNNNTLDAGVDAAPPNYDPLPPVLGTQSTEPVDCTGAYALPEELTGTSGLAHHGWTLDDLAFTRHWGVPTKFENKWLSNNLNNAPSLRVRPWLVPEAGTCYQQGLQDLSADAAAGTAVLHGVLQYMTAFSHSHTPYDELAMDRYTAPSYDLSEPTVLVRAIRGLWELPNALPDAPDTVAWDSNLQQYVAQRASLYPQAFNEAVAELLLAMGEAYLLKWQAVSAVAPDQLQQIFNGFKNENYASPSNGALSPQLGAVNELIAQLAPDFDRSLMVSAALRVVDAADRCRQTLATLGPVDATELDLLTAHGRILLRTTDSDDEYSVEQLADAVLVIDMAGNDVYHGQYAATHELWMSASVLIDLAGDDLYSPEAVDVEDASQPALAVFNRNVAFTQGLGLFGVGVLLDDAGDDVYRASALAQGSGAFGVGVLFDRQGQDTYRLGSQGQGTGFFGIGLALDAAGDDDYGAYNQAQGVGKPEGHGLLLDLDGHDRYVGYYVTDGSALPEPGYAGYFPTSYTDSEGRAHNMSVVQGVGWGYRHEWLDDQTLWRGGFGALVDLGEGDDDHYADCMAIGQGFVFGFGFLFDGGGDDIYRGFWWGQGASAHMGISLIIEEDGNDDHWMPRLSGGYGYDYSVGWLIDHGGNDTYGGQMNYGRAYAWSMTFMLNIGGDDVYNAGWAQSNPGFGYVDDGIGVMHLLGAFLDLGGGNDTYNTHWPGVGNNTEWYTLPTGDSTNPDNHKGIGIDR